MLLQTGSETDVTKLVRPGLDWDFVFASSARHGLTPLLYKMIADYDAAGGIPPNIHNSLQKGYLASLMRNQNFYRLVNPLLDTFSAAGIPVMLLKGTALCLTVYEDMALRPFGDVDILVKKEHVKQGQQFMDTLGYSLITNNYFPIPDERNDELGCEWSYHTNGNVVELHWDLVTRIAPFRVDIETYWKSARKVELDGQTALIMSPAGQLLHLCLHQYKHHWMHLRDLVDVALIIESYSGEIDWDELAREARRQGLGRCVYYTVMLTHQVLGTNIDEIPMADILGRSRPNVLALGLKDMIADNILESHMPRRFWELLLVDGARNKTLVVRQTLAHPFPRKQQRGQKAPGTRSSSTKKAGAALRSAYFYRRLLIEFPRYVLRTMRRITGRP